MDQEKKGSSLTWVIAVVIIALIAYGAYAYVKKDQNSVTETPAITDTTGDTSSEATTTSYKDGSYTAIGNYNSPGGAEELQVSLTLIGGVITDANVISLATRPESKMMQGKFISGYKPLVIGKKIDDVKLTKVSGSSLSPKGFNDAVAKIKTEASV